MSYRDRLRGRLHSAGPLRTRTISSRSSPMQSKIILGAHLIEPQASSMIQALIQAMSFEQPAPQVARGQYWIHPAMIESSRTPCSASATDRPNLAPSRACAPRLET